MQQGFWQDSKGMHVDFVTRLLWDKLLEMEGKVSSHKSAWKTKN